MLASRFARPASTGGMLAGGGGGAEMAKSALRDDHGISESYEVVDHCRQMEVLQTKLSHTLQTLEC